MTLTLGGNTASEEEEEEEEEEETEEVEGPVEEPPKVDPDPICGENEILQNGVCVPKKEEDNPSGDTPTETE